MLFHHHFGEAYRPEVHWTSPLRYRTGQYDADKMSTGESLTKESSFTISDEAAVLKITEFLIRHNFLPATSWKGKDYVCHFEVAVTPSGSTEEFSWNTSQLERVSYFFSILFLFLLNNRVLIRNLVDAQVPNQ